MDILDDMLIEIIHYIAVDNFYDLCLINKRLNTIITTTYWSDHEYNLLMPNLYILKNCRFKKYTFNNCYSNKHLKLVGPQHHITIMSRNITDEGLKYIKDSHNIEFKYKQYFNNNITHKYLMDAQCVKFWFINPTSSIKKNLHNIKVINVCYCQIYKNDMTYLANYEEVWLDNYLENYNITRSPITSDYFPLINCKAVYINLVCSNEEIDIDTLNKMGTCVFRFVRIYESHIYGRKYCIKNSLV